MAGLELELVSWLRGRQCAHRRAALGIGDDMAMLAAGSSKVLLASDMLLDGVHFDTTRHDLRAIGRKAIACNLSDCAAMAVRPLAAVVSVALPVDWSLRRAQALFEGMFEIAEEFELAVVGGDTNSWTHPLAIDVAITAVPYDGIQPVRRSGAKPGDSLWVTGPLGGSLLGRHLTFTPRVHEAKELAEALGPRLHAMMDVTDGLSLDLWRMCRESGVGAFLDETLLGQVISDDARRLSEMDRQSPLDHALGDGEDFELLLAVEGGTAKRGLAMESTMKFPTHLDLRPVGTVVGEGLQLRRADGSIEALKPTGYVH